MPSGKRPHFYTNRVNEDIARELTYIIKDVKDPRVSKSFVSVTKTEITPDLKYCKVYYSNMMGDDKEVKTGLYSAMGYIKRELSSRLSLRNTPEISFIRDSGLEHGARIAELLKNIEDNKSSGNNENIAGMEENIGKEQ